LFTVIEPYQTKKRPRKTLKADIKSYKDISYFVLPFPIYKGNFDWKGLNCDKPFLVPKNLTPTNEICVYGGKEWKERLCIEIVKKKVEQNKYDCIIFDPKAKYKNDLIDIVPYSRTVSIFTSYPNAFDDCVKTFREDFGCNLNINSSAGLKSGICFNPQQGSFNNQNFSVISPKDIGESTIKIPAKYRGIGIKNLDVIGYSEVLFTECNKGSVRDYINI